MSSSTGIEKCGIIDIDLESVPEKSEPFLFYTSLFLLTAAVVFFPVAVSYYLENRKNYTRLYRRHTPYVLLFNLGIFLHVIIYTIRNIIGPANFPCAIFFFVTNLQAVFMFITIGTRLLSLYLRINFNRILLKSTFNTLQQGALMFQIGEETFKPVPEGNKEGSIEVPQDYNDIVTALPKSQTVNVSDTKTRHSFWLTIFKYLCCAKEVDMLPRNVQVAYFLSTTSFHYRFYIILCSLCIGVFNTTTFVFIPLKCTGCRLVDVSEFVIVPVLFLVIWIIVLYCLLRKHKDPLGIKKEMTIICAVFLIVNIGVAIPGNLFLPELEEEGKWDWSMIAAVQMFFFGYISLVHQVSVAKKLSAKSTILDEDIHKILSDEEGTKAFALYLAVHLSIENLYFYKAVETWKQKYDQRTDESNLQRGQHIFDTFLSNSSTFQINIGYLVLNEIKHAFESDEAINDDVFDKAQAEALELLSGAVFYQFLQSSYYSLYKNNVDLSEQL